MPACALSYALWCVVKRSTIRCQGGGARKNFEINKILLENGEKDISTKGPCIYFLTENVKKNILAPLRPEINNFSSPDLVNRNFDSATRLFGGTRGLGHYSNFNKHEFLLH